MSARLLVVAVLVAVSACGGGEGDGNAGVVERFEAGIAGDASCRELFRLRNRLDPKDSRIPRMNRDLRRVGCYSNTSERTD